MKSLHQHIEERLIINKRFDEKLIINKDYIDKASQLLELAKKIWCDPQNIDAKVSKDAIQYTWLWVTDKDGGVTNRLLNFADEIINNINEYNHIKLLWYHKYRTDEHNKNKMLKEIITIANEEDLSELLFQSNSRASKNNVQLIRIKDDDMLMYIIGKSLFKKGKFDVDNIEKFKIIILYND